MKFTRKQCELLLNIFNADVANAIKCTGLFRRRL